MELSPAPTKAGEQQKFSAECRCPPMKAQSARDGKCYDLYSRGPCDKGSFFAPDTKYNNNSNNSKRTWGLCVQMQSCNSPNEIYWPKNGKCYQKLTKGPCIKGQLIVLTPDRIPECKCNRNRELRDYYSDGNCYQHFTKGPCKEKGHLFLPDRTCGCHSFLPHYHEDTERCFEIGSIGPCGGGEVYQLHPETRRGICQCKSGYIRFLENNSCYRPFTQGPCGQDEIIVNSTSCIKQACQRGYLYFPEENSCHRIGSRGPCARGRIITFDFSTRPSIDGVSYNGVCSCEKDVYSDKCSAEDPQVCDKTNMMVLHEKRCYKLYSQGPCQKGAWLAPRRHKKSETLWLGEDEDSSDAVCECIPGYSTTVRTSKNGFVDVNCMPPTVILAEFLNRNFTAIAQIFSLS